MGTIDISYLSLGIGLLLLSIPLFYIWKFKTGLLRATLIGTARMIVQLFFIGIYLKYLFLWNNPWINFLWVIVMILVASQTALARTQLKRKILLIPISVGFLCSVVCVGMYFIGIVLRLENVFSAQYFIPIFGILMGNMLSSNVIALNTYYSGLKREQQLYRYLLGNGATCRAACIITVTGTGRPSPKINVLRKHLPHVGSAHCLAVQGQYFGITFIRPCKLCEYPQYKDIEHGKEYAESDGYSN